MAVKRPKASQRLWIVTALFCLQIGFTAYAQLRLPQVAEQFTHLGFPDYFRVELSWAKLLGVVLMLAPVPARLKEWVYAALPSTSPRRSLPTSRWAMARRRGVGRQPPACSGGSRTFSGAAGRPRRRAPDRARRGRRIPAFRRGEIARANMKGEVLCFAPCPSFYGHFGGLCRRYESSGGSRRLHRLRSTGSRELQKLLTPRSRRWPTG